VKNNLHTPIEKLVKNTALTGINIIYSRESYIFQVPEFKKNTYQLKPPVRQMSVNCQFDLWMPAIL
jgi:hypothetical protein